VTEEKLLHGVVDFHIHCEPSFMERACDFVELCYRADKAGYRAVAHKDHNYGSAHNIHNNYKLPVVRHWPLNHHSGNNRLGRHKNKER